jgi:hypothetical protein
VIDLLMVTKLGALIKNVPTLSLTTSPDGHELTAAWIALASSPPLGESVAQIVVRFGMPPTDWSPAIFQLAEASRSDGSRPTVGSLELLEAVLIDAEHDAVAPPSLPAQFQYQGPLPMTVDALPALQRLAVGAVLTAMPFALPHLPVISAEQRVNLLQLAASRRLPCPLLPAFSTAASPILVVEAAALVL